MARAGRAIAAEEQLQKDLTPVGVAIMMDAATASMEDRLDCSLDSEGDRLD